MRKVSFLLLVLFILLSAIGKTQGVGINDDNSLPAASSMLDVKSNSKGVLIPRVNLTGTNNASPVSSPATSLMVYNMKTAGARCTAVSPGFYY